MPGLPWCLVAPWPFCGIIDDINNHLASLHNPSVPPASKQASCLEPLFTSLIGKKCARGGPLLQGFSHPLALLDPTRNYWLVLLLLAAGLPSRSDTCGSSASIDELCRGGNRSMISKIFLLEDSLVGYSVFAEDQAGGGVGGDGKMSACVRGSEPTNLQRTGVVWALMKSPRLRLAATSSTVCDPPPPGRPPCMYSPSLPLSAW